MTAAFHSQCFTEAPLGQGTTPARPTKHHGRHLERPESICGHHRSILKKVADPACAAVRNLTGAHLLAGLGVFPVRACRHTAFHRLESRRQRGWTAAEAGTSCKH